MSKPLLTMTTRNYIGVKAKNLKKKDNIILGGRNVVVTETSKNAYGQVVITFHYWVGQKTYSTLIVDKNFPFNVRRVERPKRK